MTPLLLLLASYLIGAIPTSYLGGRLVRGIDLRRHGSGNLGATNVYRVLGWRVAAPVLLFDAFKGWFPTFFFPAWDRAATELWALGYAAAAVVGHVFPIYLGFRGGKGVATSAGALLALAPIAVGAGLLVWVALVAVTRIVSLGSIVAALVVPLVAFLARGASPAFWLTVALAAFVVFAHRRNIRRLLRGEEHRFGAARRVGP